ncbi:hypothetical protein RJ641_031134 [Dillenia turbinata]|uniref:RING-type domain-containing protein n=1 Tax=Dillenia turbinata TaxID=194707 RepID=A0AAN8VWY5_9MAGN
MSTGGSRGPSLRGHAREGRRGRMVLNVDLNDVPPESREQEGTSAASAAQQEVQPSQPAEPPVPIDVEAIDDEVVISSPRAFAEAKNNSRRNRGRTVVDEDLEVLANRMNVINRNKRRRVPSNHTIINCDLYINLEGSSTSKRENAARHPSPSKPIPAPPPPKELTFNCPVCMGPIVEEMSTKCGHIFCKLCIKASISAQGKCPTCRRKVTMKDVIRVYLPAAS